MNKIKLNFINNSNGINNSDIVIFQKNEATGSTELPTAWLVIKKFDLGDRYAFTYSHDLSISSSDSWGNYSPLLPAPNGSAYDVNQTTSGSELKRSQLPASSSNEIEIRNQLTQGSINVSVYRDGRLCAAKSGISPGQKAIFRFKPTIWIGVTSQIDQGQIMNSAIIASINTELSLLGIASADIVMTGGGAGSTATPFKFSLENVVFA